MIEGAAALLDRDLELWMRASKLPFPEPPEIQSVPNEDARIVLTRPEIVREGKSRAPVR